MELAHRRYTLEPLTKESTVEYHLHAESTNAGGDKKMTCIIRNELASIIAEIAMMLACPNNADWTIREFKVHAIREDKPCA